jgi:hypothetical protein
MLELKQKFMEAKKQTEAKPTSPPTNVPVSKSDVRILNTIPFEWHKYKKKNNFLVSVN